MKVYEFQPTGRPKDRRFKEYSLLATEDQTLEYILPHGEGLNGVPFDREWKTPTFYRSLRSLRQIVFRFCGGLVWDKSGHVVRPEAHSPQMNGNEWHDGAVAIFKRLYGWGYTD